MSKSEAIDYTATVSILNKGGVIAYPTEAVYGLGCDPFNESAINRLNALKKRESSKGFILLITDWEQLATLIKPITQAQHQRVANTWPGPTTWVFPSQGTVPTWLTGHHLSIAVRMTAHPIAQNICRAWSKPFVSTSANISNASPARTIEAVHALFGNQIDSIIPGELGTLAQPTPIFDAVSGKSLRL